MTGLSFWYFISMIHTGRGWTRVLYSTEVKLYSWIPEMVVTFLTKTALVQSTTWVKREAEKEQKAGKKITYKSELPDISKCFKEDPKTGGKYRTYCSEGRKPKRDEL
jgi:hypothetical protein